MDRAITIVSIVLIISVADCCAEPFNSKDWAWQAYVTAIAVADWGTTLDMVGDPDYYETNPIIGKYPSRSEINTWFLVTIPLKYIAARILPTKHRLFGVDYNPRRMFQVVAASVSTAAVANNYSIGLRINF